MCVMIRFFTPFLYDFCVATLQIFLMRLPCHIGMNDYQIASIAYRLQIPLDTHNLKDMKPMVGELAQKPY